LNGRTVEKYDRPHGKFASVDPARLGRKSKIRVSFSRVIEISAPDNLTENRKISSNAFPVL
jgi:hypothetical protein